ncbi:MAG: hypothetical protein ACREI7_06935, partial [Myxococcota bacterium]
AVAAVCLAALSVSAQERAFERSIDDRWIPSFAITGGVVIGRQHATVSSYCRAPDSDPPAAAPCNPTIPAAGSVLRTGAFDDELAVTPYVGGNLALMTPGLARLGRPRLFAGIELPYQFGIDRNVAQRQRPTGLAEPENPNVTESLDEGALLGAGSRTRSEVHGLAFGASAGVAFGFEAFGRQFRVKPSAGWLRTRIGVRGRVEHGICRAEGGIQLCDVDGIQPAGAFAFTRIVTLKAHDSIWLDGIGPGLDLEMDTGRFGPYSVSLFVGGGGYYLIGDRSLAFHAVGTAGPDAVGDPVDYHADFTFRANPWLYRGGVGVRLSWVGYD